MVDKWFRNERHSTAAADDLRQRRNPSSIMVGNAASIMAYEALRATPG